MNGCKAPPWLTTLAIALMLGSTPSLGAGSEWGQPDAVVVQMPIQVDFPNQGN